MVSSISDALPLIASGVTAAIAAVATALSRRGGAKADAAAQITTSAVTMVQELQEEVTRLRETLKTVEDEVTDCEKRYRALRDEVGRLRSLMAHHGIDPGPDHITPGL